MCMKFVSMSYLYKNQTYWTSKNALKYKFRFYNFQKTFLLYIVKMVSFTTAKGVKISDVKLFDFDTVSKAGNKTKRYMLKGTTKKADGTTSVKTTFIGKVAAESGKYGKSTSMGVRVAKERKSRSCEKKFEECKAKKSSKKTTKRTAKKKSPKKEESEEEDSEPEERQESSEEQSSSTTVEQEPSEEEEKPARKPKSRAKGRARKWIYELLKL